MSEQRFFQRQSTSFNSVWAVKNGRRLLTSGSSVVIGDGLRRMDEESGSFPTATVTAAAPPPASSNGGGSTPGGFQPLDPNVVIIMVVLLFALICAAFVNSLMRCVLRRRAQAANARAVFVARGTEESSEHGLDAKTLASLPVLTFKSAEVSKPAEVDCTICLSEFTENERLRLLPKCSHVFHLDCIDMWLLSHTSCPVCRDGVKSDDLALNVDRDMDSEEVMILTVDQDGNPSVRRGTGGEAAGGAAENAESTVNARTELKRDKSWNSLSDARLSTSRRSMSMGNFGSYREGSTSGRLGSSRSSIRAALSAILTSGDKNSSSRWQASSSSVPAASSARSSSVDRPEGTGGSLAATDQLRACSSPPATK